MLTKEEFKKVIDIYNGWVDNVEQLSEVLTKSRYSLYEFPIIDDVGKLFDCFIESHFTEEGSDIVYWWQYESVPKEIYDGDNVISVETIDELWDYLQADPKTYFK